jgi:hypothetical protein
MTFKLIKLDIQERDALAAAYNLASEELKAQIELYNENARILFGEVEAAARALEQARDDAIAWAQSIGADAQEEYRNKTEKWQEGDTGQDAATWANLYEEFDIEPVEVEFEEIEEPDIPEDVFEDLPDSMC